MSDFRRGAKCLDCGRRIGSAYDHHETCPKHPDNRRLVPDGGRQRRSTTPSSELSSRDRENFRTFLHDHGIRVTVDEAREYYGNREKIEREATEPLDGSGALCPNCMGEITQEGLLLEGDPGFCPHCGEDLAEGGGDPADLIEEVTVRLTPGQLGAVEKGAQLTDATPEEFCREAIRGRVQALENVLQEMGAER